MPKRATGEVRWTNGVAIARVTLHGRVRPSFEMPHARTEEEARERALVLADLARRLRRARTAEQPARKALEMVAAASQRSLRNALIVAEELVGGQLQPSNVVQVPTFQKVGEDWTRGELARRYPDQIRVKRSVDDDIARLTKYVYPVIGGTPIDRVELDDCEDVMRRLPAELATMTRRNIGQLMVRIFRMAVYPMRLLSASPIPSGFLPSTPKQKALGHLYPDEDARLLACTSVPLEYRLLWGFLVREGMREGEAITLAWTDLDLERGAVRLDQNKTDDPRAWALQPGVAAALRRFREQHRADAEPEDRVFTDPAGGDIVGYGLAELLRQHLRTIGLEQERPELFTSTEHRHRIRVHDLRGSFVTIHLAMGKSESWIQDRTGHRSSAMIARYKRTARTFAELRAGELSSLDWAIPELREPPSAPSIAHRLPTEPDFLSHLRELNPGPTVYEIGQGGAQGAGSIENGQKASAPRSRSSALVGADGQSVCHLDPVEAALAEGLARATAAGQWAVVEQFASELRARREAAAGVVQLDAERKRRGL